MAETIADIWKRDKDTIYNKSLQQILKFSGDGLLTDNSQTSTEMREFFNLLPTSQIELYIDECLNSPFENSGFALQDLVNEIGKGLGFKFSTGYIKAHGIQLEMMACGVHPIQILLLKLKQQIPMQ